MNIDRTIHCYRITIGDRYVHLSSHEALDSFLYAAGYRDVVVEFHRGGGRYEAMEVAA